MPDKFFNGVKCWLDAGLSFFYPECCQYCGSERARADQGFVCASCWQDVKFITPPFCERCGLPYEGDITVPFECSNCREMDLHFCQARAAVVARGMVLEIIHRYKYQRALWFEPFLADLLVRQAAPALREDPWDMIVPVPLHHLKESEREFNQAERLGFHLSAATQVPLNRRLVQRVEPTRTQTRLSRAERAANVRRAFALKKSDVLKGKRVVLIDDVFTTGATTSACAKVLLMGGAAEISVWSLARGLLR
jgi:ComF family protein